MANLLPTPQQDRESASLKRAINAMPADRSVTEASHVTGAEDCLHHACMSVNHDDTEEYPKHCLGDSPAAPSGLG